MNVEESTFTAPNQRDARQAALALVTGLAANRSFETGLPGPHIRTTRDPMNRMLIKPSVAMIRFLY